MRRDDRGSITPLVIGLTLVVALLVVVVIDASAGYLARENLNATADAAALAATDGVQGEQVYTHGIGDDLTVDLTVDQGAAQEYVAAYLTSSGATERYDALDWSVAIRGGAVVVRLRAAARMPLPLPGFPRTTTVTASGSALLRLGG